MCEAHTVMFLWMTVCLLSVGLSQTQYINPVILIPGDGGSRIMVEVNEDHDEYRYCATKILNQQMLWLNYEYLIPFTINCLTERLTLHYQPDSLTTTNRPGVVLTNPGWGKSENVEYLDTSQFVKYFAEIVNGLLRNGGYKRDISIRGAPYDFRKGPHELGDFQQRLRKLIEDTYKINGNQPVILVAHSYGCPLTLHMLQHSDQAWKDKFVRSFVSIEGPYYGSVDALRMFLFGKNLNIPTIRPSWLRDTQRSWPSSYFLFPDERQWSDHEVILKDANRSYTSHDYQQLFADYGYPQGWQHYSNVRQFVNPEVPPGVETFCIIASGVPTISRMDCSGYICEYVYGDGDGTVPWRSLHACSRWKGVNLKTFPRADHFGILKDSRLTDYIVNEVLDNGTPV